MIIVRASPRIIIRPHFSKACFHEDLICENHTATYAFRWVLYAREVASVMYRRGSSLSSKTLTAPEKNLRCYSDLLGILRLYGYESGFRIVQVQTCAKHRKKNNCLGNQRKCRMKRIFTKQWEKLWSRDLVL